MYIANPMTTVTPGDISCSGTATVTLSFDASSALSAKPVDLALILDRSGSMASPRLEYARAAADQLIDLVMAAGGGGSRMGMISFSDDALADSPLTEDAAALHAAVAGLQPGGSTNHTAAFEAAEALLLPRDGVRRVAVLFTDGLTTAGGDPSAVAERMKTNGIEVYCIGLGDHLTMLSSWASEPAQSHTVTHEDPLQLERMFREIAAEVVLAGALDVVLHETLSPDFKIIRMGVPTDGRVQVTGPRSLVWTMDAVGLTPDPTPVSLSFQVMHTGSTGGLKLLSQSTTYQDRAGNELVFPAATLTVTCSGAAVFPESCPAPARFQVEGCRDAARVQLPETSLQSLGRIVQVDAVIRNVCPGRELAAAVILTEVGPDGAEYNRGMKTVAVPVLTGDQCRDVTLRCISFVVPENSDSLCARRSFRARVLANYADTDFVCCDADSVII